MVLKASVLGQWIVFEMLASHSSIISFGQFLSDPVR
jgi:hypothetical protein